MLNSLKKWVQDVAVDFSPQPPPPSHPPTSSSSTHHYFYSTIPSNEPQQGRKSSAPAVYLSRPISLDSMGSPKTNLPPLSPPLPPALPSPVELDLSHLNREEQEHIANVLRRARAAEEHQLLSPFPSLTVPTLLSPSASIPSSLSTSSSSSSTSSSSSSSSSTSTSSFPNERQEKYDNEISDKSEKPSLLPKSIFCPIHQCQKCGREHAENSMICSSCQKNESIGREIEINQNFLDQQLLSINKSLAETNEPFYDNIHMDQSRRQNLTEIDENDFLYEEPSPYQSAMTVDELPPPPPPLPSVIPSYQIDELMEDEDSDERDHVKELELTIANLTRHMPSEEILVDLSPSVPNKASLDDETNCDLPLDIESPLADQCFQQARSLSISIPTPINNHHRNSLSRSSGIKEHLTDLLSPTTSKSHSSLERTSSTNGNKRMLVNNRQKRNLPSVPNHKLCADQLQIRRTNSESRFRLPAVPISTSPNLDDESDLLEIDLNDPIGSMNRTLRSTTDPNLDIRKEKVINPVKIKQHRDQTTNTPPISTLTSTIKSKKKPLISNEINHQVSPPSIAKLEKSTSTEITYPFPVTKLILHPSRQGLGFRITGGHSNSTCMEVTACIETIDKNHRNYQILQNAVQEGDEVLELAGVSLRGKSAVFVENLMNTIKSEFEIIVRSQLISSFVPIEQNVQRRHSIDTSIIPVTNNTVIKSKTTSISSLEQIDKADEEAEESATKTEPVSPKEEPSNGFAHRQRTNLLPNDPGINGTGGDIPIHRQNSNESGDTDSLSQYFHASTNPVELSTTTPTNGRSQSVNPVEDSLTNSSANRLQNFLKSDSKRPTRNSTSVERKSSLSFAGLKFLRKKTKSVDFSHKNNAIQQRFHATDYVGDIELQIGHDSDREQLVIRIIRAKNLLPKDTNGYSDPFVKVYLLPGRDQENKRRIKHVSKTLNPVWDQTVVYAHMHREEVQYKKLEFTVWDFDRFKANDFLGQVTVDLKNPNAIDDKPHWYRLQPLRAREEITNRGSSPRLFQMNSMDSSASLATNKNSVNPQSRHKQIK